MESLILLRRFFVYSCAFVGAGFFGYSLYFIVSHHFPVPNEYWWIIGAAVVVAALLAYLEPYLHRASSK